MPESVSGTKTGGCSPSSKANGLPRIACRSRAWALITPLFLWLGETLAQLILTRSHLRRTGLRKAVIIGLTEPGLRLEQQLISDPSLRIQVAGYFEDRQSDRLPAEGLDRILGRQSELLDFVRQNNVNVAYVTLPMTPDSVISR